MLIEVVNEGRVSLEQAGEAPVIPNLSATVYDDVTATRNSTQHLRQALHFIHTPDTENQGCWDMGSSEGPTWSLNPPNNSLGKLLKLCLLPFLPYSKTILNTLKYGFYFDCSNEPISLYLKWISHEQIWLYYIFVSCSLRTIRIFTPLPKSP